MSGGPQEEARRLLSSGRTAEAVALLASAIAAGGAPGLRALHGMALFHDGRISEARRALAEALDLFPFDAAAHDAHARILWMDGERDRFADRFLAAVAARPGDAQLRFRCADLLRLAGDHQRAEALLREGLARAPSNATLAATLGVLLDETGRLDEALQVNGDIASAFPGVPVLQLNLAHTLMRLGRGQDALNVLIPLRQSRPDLQQAITYEAMALRQLDDPRHDWLCDYARHVQVYELDPPPGYASLADFNRALGACLRAMMDAREHPLEQSLRGGRQTSYNLLFSQDPVFRSYLAALDRPIRAYIAGLGDDRTHPLEGRKAQGYALAGCWSVLLRPGGFHVNHTHPDGWISSAYYVSLPSGMGGVSGHDGWIKFGEPRWPVPGCGIERLVEPREGRLVLFPSYMWHGTVPFASGERMTTPFDVLPA